MRRSNCSGFCSEAGIPRLLSTKWKRFVSVFLMPRPEYIARLHGAFYDLRTCEPAPRPAMLKRYKEVLVEAANTAGCSEASLQAAVASDYAAWVKQERLPRIDRR